MHPDVSMVTFLTLSLAIHQGKWSRMLNSLFAECVRDVFSPFFFAQEGASTQSHVLLHSGSCLLSICVWCSLGFWVGAGPCWLLCGSSVIDKNIFHLLQRLHLTMCLVEDYWTTWEAIRGNKENFLLVHQVSVWKSAFSSEKKILSFGDIRSLRKSFLIGHSGFSLSASSFLELGSQDQFLDLLESNGPSSHDHRASFKML